MSPDLPNELILDICDCVSQPDLLSLRAVNKTFYTITTPQAFRTLRVVNSPKSAARFLHLLNAPDITRSVKGIVYAEGSYEGRKDPEEAMIASLFSSFSSLALVPSLKTLSILFDPHFKFIVAHHWDRDKPAPLELRIQWALLEALTCNILPHPSLRTLELKNVLPYTHPLYAEPGFAALMSSLHHLALGFYDYLDLAHPYLKFWEMLSTCVLRPATALRTLSLTGADMYPGSVIAVDFGTLSSMHLTSLTLHNALFGSAWGVEDCILRHRATLQTLELLKCKIKIRKGEDMPARLWADVWECFAEELGALRELEARFDREWGRERRYTVFDPQEEEY